MAEKKISEIVHWTHGKNETSSIIEIYQVVLCLFSYALLFFYDTTNTLFLVAIYTYFVYIDLEMFSTSCALMRTNSLNNIEQQPFPKKAANINNYFI